MTMSPAPGQPAAHVVVVDDDQELLVFLRQLLTKEGLQVTTAQDGAGLRAALADGRVDLVLLDLNLHGESGLDLARFLRVEGDTPILILTAAGDPIDRVIGLEMGADDYLVKPFHARELMGRVRSLLRRSGRVRPSQPTDGVTFGPWRCDLGSAELCREDGHTIRLSPAESALLRIFIGQPGKVLSRRMLLDAEAHRTGDERSVDLRIARLRRKLGTDPGQPPLIRTVRGRGYVYQP
jgi:two-component system OmpR family response regulator